MAHTGLLLVAVAALCWGLSGGIAGFLISNGWDALLVSFFRGSIGLLFFLVWLALRPHDNGFRRPLLWTWAILAGIGVAGNFSFYFISIEKGSVAIAATLMYCAPIFVYLISFLFKIEKPTPVKWAAIVLVLVGVVLLTRVYQVGSDAITPLGVGAGLLSGLSLATFIFGFKYAAKHGSPQAVLTIAFVVLVVILALFIDPKRVTAVANDAYWHLFVVLGVLGGGLSFIFYLVGLRNTLPALASIVATIEPVTASLFGVFVLDESLVAVQVLGMWIILATVTALGVYSNKH